MFSATHFLRLLWLSSSVALGVARRVEADEDVVSVLQIASAVTHRAPIGATLPNEGPLVIRASQPRSQPAAPVSLAAAQPAAVAQPVAPIVAQQQIMVSVPKGASPGDKIQAKSPDGQTLQFPLPKGVKEGQEVPILYTPLASAVQQAPMASQQPVMMVDQSSTANMVQLPRTNPAAAQSMMGMPPMMGMGASPMMGGTSNLQTRHAISDAAMQKDAVNNVMQRYQAMSHMDDSDEGAGLAYAKAEQAKKSAEWEAVANMEAAKAAEEVVNYKSWKRSDVLKDAAMAKNELRSKMGEYDVAKAHSFAAAGTDAAWKATIA